MPRPGRRAKLHRVRRPILAALVGGAAFLLSLSAAANGRFPLSNEFAFSTTDPNLIVLRTSYGILRSEDNGTTWSLICEDALGITPSVLGDPAIGLTKNNSLLAGLYQGSAIGMNVSPDVGCNWKCIGGALAGQLVTDLAVRPDNPSSAVAVTSTELPNDSGTLLYSSQVFETTDDGVTWPALGKPLDPTIQITTVDVAKTDPQRLYVSATRGYNTIGQTAALFVSKDRGQSWIEYDLPSGMYDPTTEVGIYIGAVDPTNADRLYIRSRGQASGGKSRLTAVTLSATGGAPTFTAVQTFDVPAGRSGLQGELLGLAVSSDGSKIYIGTTEDGLWMAQTSDLKFQKQSSTVVQCLATRGSELWVCSAAFSAGIAAVSTDDGKTFTSKLPLIGDLTGAIPCKANASGVACNEDANASQCPAAFDAFCMTETCGPPPEPSSGSPSSSCNCNLALAGGGGAAALGAGFAIASVALRRRRRTKR